MKDLDIVIPCYNEAGCVQLVYNKLVEVLDEVQELNWRVFYVNDGSTDTTIDEIQELAKNDAERVKYISFSRNFGKEAAIIAGLTYSEAEYVVLMDADLQHPPELLPEMLNVLENEDYDVCGARRVSRRGEPVIRSAFSNLFYLIMKKLTGLDMVPGGSDYRMMKRAVVDAIVSLHENGRFSKGIFSWVGFNTKWIPYHNVERAAGKTKWSFSGLASYAINGFFAFAATPLRIAIWIGFIVDILTLIFGIRYMYRSLHYGAIGNGVGTLTMITAFFGGTIILILGLIGEYLARIYIEVKKRPLFVVKDSNIGKNGEDECK